MRPGRTVFQCDAIIQWNVHRKLEDLAMLQRGRFII